MKTNAIMRIVLYSIVIILLLAILIAGLTIDLSNFQFGAFDTLENELDGVTSFDRQQVSKIEIDWAAGSIRLITARTEWATGDISLLPLSKEERYPITYEIVGQTLRISYTNVGISSGSIPPKDLIIAVPEDWFCKELQVDGAALDMSIENVQIGTLDLDGASCQVALYGSVETVECDGAACELDLYCVTRPNKIDLDGAACKLDLTLPENCGFRVEMNGLSCHFNTKLPCTQSDGVIRYGDEHCQITADGLSCDVSISIPN